MMSTDETAQAVLQACPAIGSMERAHKVVEAILRSLPSPDGFEPWLREVCFQKPTPEAYDLAKCAWQQALRAAPEHDTPAGAEVVDDPDDAAALARLADQFNRLWDEIRLTIVRLATQPAHGERQAGWSQEAYEAILAKGIAEGLERAAKWCDEVRAASWLIHNSTTTNDPDHMRFFWQGNGADECGYKLRNPPAVPEKKK